MGDIKLVIADDSALVREILEELLKTEYDIVASVADGKAAVEATRRYRPSAVLLDISMPVLNGLQAAKEIKEAYPQTPLIFVSEHRERAYVESAFEAGAAAYVTKSKMVSELMPAIKEVLAGRDYGRPQPSTNGSLP